MPTWVCDEITFQCPKCNGCTVKVWGGTSKFIQDFTIDVIVYPCWDKSNLLKWPCSFGKNNFSSHVVCSTPCQLLGYLIKCLIELSIEYIIITIQTWAIQRKEMTTSDFNIFTMCQNLQLSLCCNAYKSDNSRVCKMYFGGLLVIIPAKVIMFIAVYWPRRKYVPRVVNYLQGQSPRQSIGVFLTLWNMYLGDIQIYSCGSIMILRGCMLHELI